MSTSDRAIDVVIMRGGTSKGVFVRGEDLPGEGLDRDSFILSLMGTPDPMQIDGLGGTHSSTSKLVAVSPSNRPSCDAEYLFVQVGVDRPIVDYSGNCGNLTAAVGAYAVDEGLVAPSEPMSTVRLFNQNTGRRILAHVPVAGGRAVSSGDAVLAGVPGTGAALVTEFLDPAGSATGALLPTGRTRDLVTPRLASPLEVSIVDVSAPVALVRSSDLELPADIGPADLNQQPETLARLESVRAACAVMLGMASDEADALTSSPSLPRLLLLTEPGTYVLGDGRTLTPADYDLRVRATSMQRVHHACPLTSAMCAAAAAKIPGTIAYELAATSELPVVRIAHPKGLIAIDVAIEHGPDGPNVMSVSVMRTARRLLSGLAYVKLNK